MPKSELMAAVERMAAGDWEGAHRIVQDDPSPEAAWLHAHLHRVEGDPGNAAYWYRRAGRPVETGGLDEERIRIALQLKN